MILFLSIYSENMLVCLMLECLSNRNSGVRAFRALEHADHLCADGFAAECVVRRERLKSCSHNWTKQHVDTVFGRRFLLVLLSTFIKLPSPFGNVSL